MQAKVETPRPKPNLTDCHIYHSIDLPGGEKLHGDWDLNPILTEYTGHVDFAGKTVLDVGTATGLLTFYAESRGARVTSFDARQGCCKPIPWAQNDPVESQKRCDDTLERIKNGYWYCWNAVGSKSVVRYGDANDVDRNDVGGFDVVIVGAILIHLENPVGALIRLSRLADHTILVVNLDPDFSRNPVLLPNVGVTGPEDTMSWWSLPVEPMSRLLEVVGFKIEHIERFSVVSPSMGHTGRFYCLRAARRA